MTVAKIQLFSEYVNVAYQIQGNVANILPVYTSSTTRVWGQKIKTFFLKVVMVHIKLKGMDYRAPCKHIICPYTHQRPLGGVKRSKHFFSESSHVAYQN